MTYWQNIGLQFLANNELPLLSFVAFIWWGVYFLWQKKKRTHYLFIVFLTIFYAFLTFHQLGSTQAPKTNYQNQGREFVNFDFGKIENIDSLYIYSSQGEGNRNDPFRIYTRGVEIYTSENGKDWLFSLTLNKEDYMKWVPYHIQLKTRYLQLRFHEAASIIDEIGFYQNENQVFIEPKISNATHEKEAKKLIDEQYLLQINFNYLHQSYFDEIYHVRNGNEIANDWQLYTAVHPLLGTRLIALGISLFGSNPFGYRFFGALCSVLSVPLFFFLAKEVFRKERFSNLAALLFCLDFMHYTTGRIATLEPFSVFWILAMYYFMMKFLHTYSFYQWQKASVYLLLSGVSMGIAWATKWTSIYASIGLAILFFYSLYKHYRLSPKGFRRKKILFYYLLVATLCFVIIPFYIYLFSYYGIRIYPDRPQNFLEYSEQVWRYTREIFTYHQQLTEKHPFASTWYMWLFDLRPIWYYVNYSNYQNISTIQSISCFNNPVISLFGLFAILQILFQKQYKLPKNFMPLTAYLISLACWIPINRDTFAYHYYPSIPFLILLIVSYLEEVEKHSQKKMVTTIFVGLSIFLFVIFLPAISGYVSQIFYLQKFLKWLPTWYFG